MESDEEGGKVYTVTQRTKEKQECCKHPCYLIVIVIAFIVSFGFAIFQIVVGSLYNDKCSIDFKIPIFIIVAGVVHLILLLFVICRMLEKCTTISQLIYVVGLIYLGWIITGGIWTFRIRSIYQSIDPNLTNTYCHELVYRTALATILLTIVLLINELCNRN